MSLTVKIAVWGKADDPFCAGMLRWLRQFPPQSRGDKAAMPAIAVLSPRLQRIPAAILPPRSAVIFWGDSAVSADFAAASGALPLDVGFSRRATLTFSSMKEHSAALSLQRAFCPLAGEMLEPQEWLIRTDGAPDAEVLLAAAAVHLAANGTALRHFFQNGSRCDGENSLS